MPPLVDVRGPHPCLERGCGHSDTDHLPTPELAGPNELIVWCAACRRHESRRKRSWFRRAPSTGSAKARLPPIGGPN